MEDKRFNPKEMFYGCCPICKAVLIQAQNGLNGYIRCPQCGNYIHVIIRNNAVTTKKKD